MALKKNFHFVEKKIHVLERYHAINNHFHMLLFLNFVQFSIFCPMRSIVFKVSRFIDWNFQSCFWQKKYFLLSLIVEVSSSMLEWRKTISIPTKSFQQNYSFPCLFLHIKWDEIRLGTESVEKMTQSRHGDGQLQWGCFQKGKEKTT